jgi:hypothetical protein
MLAGKQVDMCAYVAYVSPLEKLNGRKDPTSGQFGQDRYKRYLTLFDDSLHSIDVTLWGSLA